MRTTLSKSWDEDYFIVDMLGLKVLLPSAAASILYLKKSKRSN